MQDRASRPSRAGTPPPARRDLPGARPSAHSACVTSTALRQSLSSTARPRGGGLSATARALSPGVGGRAGEPAEVLGMDPLGLQPREVLWIGHGATRLDRASLALAEQVRIVAVEPVADGAQIAAPARRDVPVACVFLRPHVRVRLV